MGAGAAALDSFTDQLHEAQFGKGTEVVITTRGKHIDTFVNGRHVSLDLGGSCSGRCTAGAPLAAAALSAGFSFQTPAACRALDHPTPPFLPVAGGEHHLARAGPGAV